MNPLSRWLLALPAMLVFGIAVAQTRLPGEAPTAGPPDPAVILPTRSCESLASVDLGSIGGAGSHVVQAALTRDKAGPVCEVQGHLAPSIEFTLRLPVNSWSQRLLQVGCGGLCGRVNLEVGAASGCLPLARNGFALASTDMGHQGDDATWGNDPQKRIDFAYRAVHLTAVASKVLVRAYYGQPQRYAYFTGCSDGGREALMEAQRYPEDFNGIIAGAAALNFQLQNSVYHAWMARSNTGPDGKALITAQDLPLIHQAVLAQCDTLDGEQDGLLADPQACHFNPDVLACPPGQTNGCLSPAQVTAVQRFYSGPLAANGQPLLPGSVQPGSELAWAGVFVPLNAGQPIFSARIALQALRYLSYPNNPPQLDLAGVSFDRAALERLRPLHALYDADNPDLSAFERAGGKLVLWHGWADPHISPLSTLAYHQAVVKTMGQPRANGFERLYLLPGVHHCGGGEGPSDVDFLTPMLDWVEAGKAPGAIRAKAASADEHSAFGAPEARRGGAPNGPPGAMGQPPIERGDAKAVKDSWLQPWAGAKPLAKGLGEEVFRP